ncbi:MAG: hypothetical protein Q9184_001746 [Pyrenodesmia sp. 2 TL-2023]
MAMNAIKACRAAGRYEIAAALWCFAQSGANTTKWRSSSSEPSFTSRPQIATTELGNMIELPRSFGTQKDTIFLSARIAQFSLRQLVPAQALEIMFVKDASDAFAALDKDEVQRLLDYTRVGRLTECAKRNKPLQVKFITFCDDLEKVKAAGYGKRIQAWKQILGCLAEVDQTFAHPNENIDDERLKLFPHSWILNLPLIETSTSLDYLATDALQRPILAVRDAMMGPESQFLPTMLMLSGTGKTKTLVGVGGALLQVRHKLLVCAPGNGPVDHDAIQLSQNIPHNMQSVGVHMLRMSSQSLEKHKPLRTLLSDAAVDTTQLPGEVLDEEPLDIEQDPRIMEAVHALMSGLTRDVAKEELFQNHLDKLQAVAPHIAAAEEARVKPRGTQVPWKLELAYHFQRIVSEDVKAAAKKLEDLKATTPKTEWHTLPTLESLNLPHHCRLRHNYFARKEGELKSKEMKICLRLREEIASRIIKEQDIILVTLNTAGGEIADIGFDASVIIVDEAGQASFASLFVPLQNARTWKAVLLFGDPRQLKPMFAARDFSEVLNFSEQTALQTSFDRDRKVVLLRSNYRMLWRTMLNAEHFRKVSKDDGVRGPNGDGSEYYFYNVVYGESHVEENGTSLLNHANADAVCGLIDWFLAAVIPPASIVVLTLYKAQLKLLMLKISRMDDGRPKYHLISTTDAFQDQEGPVFIVDLVVAKNFGDYKAITKASASYDNEEKGEKGAEVTTQPADGETYSNISTFTRDYHRLCLALTRTIDGLMVVGQIANHYISSLIKTNDPRANTLPNLAEDAMQRGLIAGDKDHLDTPPKTQQQHEAIKKRQDNQILRAREDAERHSFYQSFVKWGLEKASEREGGSGRGTGLPHPQRKPRGKGRGNADNPQRHEDSNDRRCRQRHSQLVPGIQILVHRKTLGRDVACGLCVVMLEGSKGTDGLLERELKGWVPVLNRGKVYHQ